MISRLPVIVVGARRVWLGLLCAALTALALGAPPAWAATPTHPLLLTLTGTGRPPEHTPPPYFNFSPDKYFEDACGIAVDSNGDIYLADYYHDAVDVYDSAGFFLTQIVAEDPIDGPCGLAVDSSGDVYVNNWRRNVVKFTPAAFPPGLATKYGPGTVIDSGGSTGVALDPATGNVYVDDRTYVSAYEPSGAPVLRGGAPLKIGLGTLGAGYGVAVSDFPATEGDVYVSDAIGDTVKVYKPAGDPINPAAILDGSGTPQEGFSSLVDSSLAVDQATGHIYVADELHDPFEHRTVVINEFNSSGAYRGQLPQAIPSGEPSGLAVNGAGSVYLSGGNSEEAALYVFGAGIPAHSLEVLKAGTGQGTVTSAAAGIRCGSACVAEYNEGEALALTATPSPSSVFLGFSGGGCSGTGPCQLSLGAETKVSAEFEAIPQRALSVEVGGSGEGAVSSAPAGIDCEVACSSEFNQGSQVALTAKPAPLGSLFTGWTVNGSGATCAGSGVCALTLNEATTVKANFQTVAVHTLDVSALGTGSLSSAPAGIECGPICSAQYNQGTEVELSALPGAHQAFGGWSGGGCSGAGACKVTVNGDTTVTASFAPIPRTLTLAKGGSGSGTVTSGPAGIDCGAVCSHDYEEGSEVTLSAIPAPGSTFSGWSGGGCSGQGTCHLTLGVGLEVTASFAAKPAPEKAVPPPSRFALGSASFSPSGRVATLEANAAIPGSLLATGKGLKRIRASASGRGATALRLTLTGTAEKRLAQAGGHGLKIKVKVVFTPSDGAAATVLTKTLTFKAKGDKHR